MQASDAMPVDQAIDRSIRAVLSSHRGSQLVPTLGQEIRDAMVGHFVKEWPRVLPPNQHAVMAYTTIDRNYKLRITIDYEDEAGYQWQRTDTSQPRRADEETPMGGSADGVSVAPPNRREPMRLPRSSSRAPRVRSPCPIKSPCAP